MSRIRVPVNRRVFRDGKVHVCKQMCPTCIFRPGNLMNLNNNRVEGMVRDAGDDGCIPCHGTLDGEQAVCHGFYTKHRNQLLQLAERFGVIEFVGGS